MIATTPSTAAGNGRGPGGQFAAGNTMGRGNPNNRKAQELRNALLAAVTPADVEKCLATIRDVMDAGKPHERLAAAEALLDRLIGKPVAADVAARLEELEAAVAMLARPSDVGS